MGPDLDLLEDGRCAFAMFCHREDGDVWELTENTHNPKYKAEAIKAASDCPTGRLVAIDKTGKIIEPEYETAIEILQDPGKGVSGPIFVKGNIPIESSDGDTYEIGKNSTGWKRIVSIRCYFKTTVPQSKVCIDPPTYQ